MTPLLSFLLFFTTLGGGLLPFLIVGKPTYFPSLLTFSGSYLFSSVLLHMVPELFEHVDCNAHGGILANPGLFLLLGFLLQLFLDLLGANVTHGHMGEHPLKKSRGCCLHRTSSLHFLVPALLLHSLLDGFLIKETDMNTFFAVLLHKIPAAFTLTTILCNRNHRRKSVLIILVLFSLATPIGSLLYQKMRSGNLLAHPYDMWLSAIAIGSLFHIAATILFESNPNHQLHRSKWIAIFAGALLAILNQNWMHQH
ncbi:MAG: ZIP family metal transporter [Cytophagales bacterium]